MVQLVEFSPRGLHEGEIQKQKPAGHYAMELPEFGQPTLVSEIQKQKSEMHRLKANLADEMPGCRICRIFKLL